MSDDETVRAAIEVVKAAGYDLIRVPACKRSGGHGRHTLRTRSVMCEGVEPVPHGFHSGQRGSFGYWVNCQCGHSFADYTADDGAGLTPWAEHKGEHGFADAVTPHRA